MKQIGSWKYSLLWATCCDNALPRATVYWWVKEFQSGSESAKLQGGSGAPCMKLTKRIINTAAIYMQEDARVTVQQLASILEILVGCTHHLLTKEMGLLCVCKLTRCAQRGHCACSTHAKYGPLTKRGHTRGLLLVLTTDLDSSSLKIQKLTIKLWG